MKQILNREIDQESLSLIGDISYAQVESWFGGTYKDLKMSVICPRDITMHKKFPVIVWLCGGGFYKMDRNIWIPQLLGMAQRGFVIASPDYRTCNEAAYPGPLQDIKASIRYLRANAEKYCIDAERVYVMGESAGGAYAALCSVTNGKKEYDVGNYLDMTSAVQGIVEFYGLVEFGKTLTLENFPEKERKIATCLISYQQTLKEKEGSVMEHVQEGTPKTLIFHGTEDSLVPIEQSEAYYKKLQEVGVKSDFYIIEGAIHGDDAFYQDKIYDIIVAFLKEESE